MPKTAETTATTACFKQACLADYAKWVLCIAIVLKLLTMGLPPLLDVTETRYASIAQMMVLLNDWVTPRLAGNLEPFLGKPPLTFWLTALSFKTFGITEWAARFPTSLQGVLVALLTWRIGRRVWGDAVGWLAALLTFVSVGVYVQSMTVAMDMLVCLTTTLGSWALLGLLSPHFTPGKVPPLPWHKSLLYHVGLTLALTLGFLNKGPVTWVLMLGPLVGFVLYTRQWRLLWVPCWPLVMGVALLLSAPWYWACEQANPGFLRYFFLNENVLRYIQPSYGDRYGSGHHHIYGMSWGMTALNVLPWALWLPAVMKNSWTGFRAFITPPKSIQTHHYIWAWALFAPAFFTVAKSIVFTYFSGSVPALCLLVAVWASGLTPIASAQRWWQKLTSPKVLIASAFVMSLLAAVACWGVVEPVMHEKSTRLTLTPVLADFANVATVPASVPWVRFNEKFFPFSWVVYLQNAGLSATGLGFPVPAATLKSCQMPLSLNASCDWVENDRSALTPAGLALYIALWQRLQQQSVVVIVERQHAPVFEARLKTLPKNAVKVLHAQARLRVYWVDAAYTTKVLPTPLPAAFPLRAPWVQSVLLPAMQQTRHIHPGDLAQNPCLSTLFLYPPD